MLVVAGYDHWIPKVLATGHGSYLLSAVTIMICWAYFLDIIPPGRPLAIYWRPIHIVFHKLDLLHAPTTRITGVGLLKHIYHSPNELDVHRPSSQTQTS